MPRPRLIGPRRHTGRHRQFAPWQTSYVGRAVRLRRELSNKALARRLGLTPCCLEHCIRLSRER